mgnify:CR=1 FL=1
MAQLYYVKPGDTLAKIAQRFGTTIDALLLANVVCSPNLILVGLPLIIPTPGQDLPKAGAIPYYVIQPGDSLWCLANQFNISIPILARNNQILNPNRIFPGKELVLVDTIPNPVQLKEHWQQTGGPNCEIYGFQAHVLYVYTFAWAALGRRAIPYLLDLLRHHCAEIRYYTVMSLGRIGQDLRVSYALRDLLRDPDESVANLAALAIRRIELVRQGQKRVHLVINPDTLLPEPYFLQPEHPKAVKLPMGTAVTVLRWFIPSPTGEEGPRGGIQQYDYVQVVGTGQTGFLARKGLDEINFI